jgi:glutamine synthetase
VATVQLESIDDLRRAVAAGAIDTVVLALVDMHGRLQGKRYHAQHFIDDVVTHRAEACNYLLAVDVDMNTAPGYSLASWEQGYGDFFLAPDLATLRPIPWHEGTALMLADVEWEDGTPVAPSPRRVLQRQLARLEERGWGAMVGTELEFIVFADTYEEAWEAGYHGLTPSNQYNVDYSILGTSRVEHLLHRIRNEMAAAGLHVESAKGECNLGQHEIVFRYDDALTTCDNHAVYKTGAKEIAAQEGLSLTFMAKVNEREGNSCHVHLSLREQADEAAGAGAPVLADGDRLSKAGEHFLAGQLATLRELTLCFAPNINSYKRYQAGSFAPTAVAWGFDNRTCAFRLVGHGPTLRIECRVPGGDANPYLAVAALVAGGLHGIEQELSLPAAFEGNAYESELARVPSTLREAAELWSTSTFARSVFGDDVVDHYTNMARVELAAFDAAVTNWELYRGFERL